MAPKKVTEEVLKAEDSQSRDYELVLIISPEIVDEALGTTIDNVNQFVTGKGGIISDVEQWGKRKLAYPIRHFMEGSYVKIRFNLKPTLTREFEAKLNISEEVLRHLLINIE